MQQAPERGGLIEQAQVFIGLGLFHPVRSGGWM
jgi:hypothetical protein